MAYRFDFSWDGPYGKVVGLLRDHVLAATGGGVVVDLGCGHAAIAEPLAELGFGYVGLDADAEAVGELAARGLAGAVVDLTDAANIGAVLDRATGGLEVVAVTALDVLEHLPRPEIALAALHGWMSARRVDHLALSIPNVSHVDLAAKLLAARWDVTRTGLLDETHLRFFTDTTLDALVAACGFAELARDDVRMIFSDQAWPPDHPTVSPSSMLGRFLRTVRHSADDHAETNQFVRLYRRVARPEQDASLSVMPQVEARRPFLSVITRTQGRRGTLTDTLVCLAAQTDDDFEVVLVVNTPADDDAAAVDALVAAHDDHFRSRVRVLRLHRSHRVEPLNAGLGVVRGRYVTVLDDDDLVTGGWVEGFHRLADAHPGAVVRCVAVDQQVRAQHGTATSTSGFVVAYRPEFDLASHLAGGQSPQGTVAFPIEAIDALRIRFDEDMEVCEDLDFLLRVASLCGVVDSREVSMVYRRWEGSEASLVSVPPAVWEDALQRIVGRLDRGPLLVPEGSASRLFQAAVQERQLYELSAGELALVRRSETAERNWATLVHEYRVLEQHTRDLAADRDRWQQQAEVLQALSPRAIARRAARGLRRLRGPTEP